MQSLSSQVDTLTIAVSCTHVMHLQDFCLMLLVPAAAPGPLPRQVGAVQQHPVAHLCRGTCGFLTVAVGGCVAMCLKDARILTESMLQLSVVIKPMGLLTPTKQEYNKIAHRVLGLPNL